MAPRASYFSPLAFGTLRRQTPVSSFYDWAILAGRFAGPNPIARVADRALVRVTDRHRPFLAGISRTPEIRRALRIKTVRRLPRSLDGGQIAALLGALRCRRDLALVRLMLDGGLRPGEALGLHLDDVSYGRRRVTIPPPRGPPPGRTAKVAHRARGGPARGGDAGGGRRLRHGRAARRRGESACVPDRRQRPPPPRAAVLVRLFARACERAGTRAP